MTDPTDDPQEDTRYGRLDLPDPIGDPRSLDLPDPIPGSGSELVERRARGAAGLIGAKEIDTAQVDEPEEVDET